MLTKAVIKACSPMLASLTVQAGLHWRSGTVLTAFRWERASVPGPSAVRLPMLAGGLGRTVKNQSAWLRLRVRKIALEGLIMHQPMQGAHAQRPSEDVKPDRGWHLRMARSVSKAHYFVDGRSLCGRQVIGSNVKLEDFMHHNTHNCEVCMKRRDKLFGASESL
jgi:hypothetical protein